MLLVREFGHEGFADYIQKSGLQDAFINTLKMITGAGLGVPMAVEGVAIAHDINHLTVLGWDQSQPFMNDTFEEWPAGCDGLITASLGDGSEPGGSG